MVQFIFVVITIKSTIFKFKFKKIITLKFTKMKRKRSATTSHNSDNSVGYKEQNRRPAGGSLRKTFKTIVSRTKKHINNIKPKCKKALMKLACATAQELISDLPVKVPRIIPVPKSGGFLPLIPIFAGLSAAGSLVGGAAGVAKAINQFKTAKKQLSELERHNKQIEAVCIGKGLHLKPYKNGLGIYVTKEKN